MQNNSIARIALLLTAAISAAVWSACGSDDDGSPEPAGSPTATQAPAPTTVPTRPVRTPSADEQAVIDLFKGRLELSRVGDYDTLYATYSPAFRQQCTQQAFVASIQSAGLEPDRLDFRDVDAVIEGDTARVTYTTTYDEQAVDIVGADDPNIFTRIDGQWYDDVDSHTTC